MLCGGGASSRCHPQAGRAAQGRATAWSTGAPAAPPGGREATAVAHRAAEWPAGRRAERQGISRIRLISLVCWAITSFAISSTCTLLPSESTEVAMVIAP